MAMNLTTEQIAGALRYLAEFLPRESAAGEQMFAASEVSLRQRRNKLHASIASPPSISYSVVLEWDGEEWYGECSCPELIECVHCYVAMRQLLALNPPVITGGASPAESKESAVEPPTSPQSAAPASPRDAFANEVAGKLGRKLKTPERRYLDEVFSLWDRFRDSTQISEWSLQGISKTPRRWNYNPHTIWDRPPASPWEAWLYLAAFLEREKRERPPFLVEITDPAEIAKLLQAWRRRLNEAKWKDTFKAYADQAGSHVRSNCE